MKRDGISRDDYCPLFASWNVMEDKVYSLPIDTNIWAIPATGFQTAGAPLVSNRPPSLVTSSSARLRAS